MARNITRMTILKRALAIVLATAMLLFAFSAVAFAETVEKSGSNGIIKVGDIGARNSKTNRHAGDYSYDYMIELAGYTGWQYEFVEGSMQDLYQMLKSGDIDVLPYMAYSPERAADILYPELRMGQEVYYVEALADNVKVREDDPSSLNGRRIGVLAGSKMETEAYKFLQKYGIEAEIMNYYSTAELFTALNAKSVDACIASTFVYSIQNAKIVAILDRDDFYVAVSKSRPDLLEQLNYGQEQLRRAYPGFTINLEKEYCSDNPYRTSLGSNEKAWLDQHDVVRIATLAFDPPFSQADENGQAVGASVEIVESVLKETNCGVKAVWTLCENRREMEALLKSGDVDMITPVYHDYSWAENRKLLVSNAYISSSLGMLVRASDNAEQKLTVAVAKGGLETEYIKRNYPEVLILPCKSVSEAVDLVMRGRADAAVAQMSPLEYYAKQFKYDEYNLTPMSQPLALCFAARPEDAAIITIMNKGFARISDVQKDEWMSQYALEEIKVGFSFSWLVRKYRVAIAMILVAFAFVLVMAAGTRITNHKLATANLRIQNAQTDMQHALQVAEQASRAKTEFLFNMSHDIRTPMNAIMGFTEMALKNMDDPERATDNIKKAHKAGSLLLTIINDILDMSRIESGKVELCEIEADITMAFNEIQPVMEELAHEKNIGISFDISDITDRFVYADVTRTERIFVNIINNAIKYTPTGGTVKVSLKQIEKPIGVFASYRFTCEDNGIGMSKEFMKHAFEEFSREENTTVSGIEGTGLGLSLCRILAEKMGGTISCESVQGEGSTFTVDLSYKVQENGGHGYVVEEAKPAVALKLENLRLLLVEDNELNREIAEDILWDAGMLVETAADGVEAVDQLQAVGPDYYDVILMDVQMPRMNGYEATQAIRKMYPNKHIPIVAYSANAFEEDRQRSLDSGMDEHLAKPIDADELLKALSHILLVLGRV